MTETRLTPRDVQNAFLFVQQIKANLTKETAIFARIWYKSKAQHRSAEWFRAIDGVRRCLKRLLEIDFSVKRQMRKGAIPTQSLQIEEKEFSSREIVQRDQRGKMKREIFQKEKMQGALNRSCLSLAKLWCSFWNETAKSINILPAFDRKPNDLPYIEVLCSAISDLQVLNAIIEELLNRTRIAFNLLVSHLRTPPAPTFAPIVSVCVTTTSGLYWKSNQFLYGSHSNTSSNKQEREKSCLKSFYSILCESNEQQKSFQFRDAKSQTLMNHSNLDLHGDNSHVNQRLTVTPKQRKQNANTQSSAVQVQSSNNKYTITPMDQTEEDLGEII